MPKTPRHQHSARRCCRRYRPMQCRTAPSLRPSSPRQGASGSWQQRSVRPERPTRQSWRLQQSLPRSSRHWSGRHRHAPMRASKLPAPDRYSHPPACRSEAHPRGPTGCPAVHLSLQRQRLFIPHHIDGELVAVLQSLDSRAKICRIGDVRPVQCGHDVAGLETRRMRSGVVFDRRDQHSLFRPEILGELTW